MKLIISTFGGALTAAVYTVVAGYLAKLAIGLQGGAAYDFWGNLSRVTMPGKQYLPLLGLAVVSLLTLLLVTRATSRLAHAAQTAFATGFALVLAVVMVYALAFSGPSHIERIQGGDPLLGVPNWADSAGNNSATHLLLLLVLAWLWIRKSSKPMEHPA